MKKFQTEPAEWAKWRKILFESLTEHEKSGDEQCFVQNDIPQPLWFVSVAIHQRPKHLLALIKEDLNSKQRFKRETLLTTYINQNNFTEFHLDSIFKYGGDNKLPKELFKCRNVRHLSLKFNCLYELPAEIGYLQQLEHLALTNNRLNVQSIPHTLVFCTSLRTLLLDNNLLDALPGFLLEMPRLETVHRHGNHNYFKSTFMWYHTDLSRITPVSGSSYFKPAKLNSLAYWAARTLIGQKKNFFIDESVAPVLKDYICDIYDQFNVCQNCPKACPISHSGFKVITFKNPYLGNTCVPFQHWVCCMTCAKALEVPARLQQIAKARELDHKYECYITGCQRSFLNHRSRKSIFSCVQTEEPDGEILQPVPLTEELEIDSFSDESCSSSEFSLDFAPQPPKQKQCVIM